MDAIIRILEQPPPEIGGGVEPQDSSSGQKKGWVRPGMLLKTLADEKAQLEVRGGIRLH